MKRFFPHDVFGRLASLKVNVIILLLKCSYCLPHGIFKTKWLKKRERQKKKKQQQQQQQQTADSGTSGHFTMTKHHEISARGSLMPAGGGSRRCAVRYLVPRQDSEGGKSRPLDPYKTDPFRTSASTSTDLN